MTFWKRLRWTATAAFLALVALSWLGGDKAPHPSSGSGKPLRTAPEFRR
jgi:hypothetical protein